MNLWLPEEVTYYLYLSPFYTPPGGGVYKYLFIKNKNKKYLFHISLRLPQ